MSKSVFMSHDIMTTFWFWAELFFGNIISLAVKIKETPEKQRASVTPEC